MAASVDGGHRGRCVIGADGKPAILRGISMDVTEQKQAEENFRLAVEASPSGILLVNDSGEIVLVNSQIEKLFGYDRGELIGALSRFWSLSASGQPSGTSGEVFR